MFKHLPLSLVLLAPLLLALLAACGDDMPSTTPDAATLPPDGDVCITPRTPDPDPAFEAIVQGLERRMADSGIPGGAVAILRDGGTSVKSAVLGVRALDSCDEVTTQTRFYLGVTTPVVTSAALVAAADKGLLALTDPVTEHIALTLDGGDPSTIQVRHLLSNTEGLWKTWTGACEGTSLDTWWSARSTQPMWTPAGEVAQFGFNSIQIAGRVLEVATGKSFAAAVDDLVFAPLGMTATFDVATFLAGDHAASYGHAGTPVTHTACGSAQPSSQLFGSLEDLVKLGRFFAWGNAAVMSQSSFATMVGGSGEPAVYSTETAGYGMATVDAGGYQLRYQAGWNAGVTAMAYMPHADAMIVLVLDREVRDHSKNGVIDLLRAVAGSFGPPATTTAVASWGEYAGTYIDAVSSPGRTLTVAFDGSKLTGTLSIGSVDVAVAFAPTTSADMFQVTYANKSETVRFWRPSAGDAPDRVAGVDWRFGPPFAR